MHSLENDNELDNVARKAADAFSAEGSSNWDSMQALLDKEMPQEKRRKRFIWWLLPAMILGGMGIYWITEKQESPTITISKKSTITPARSANIPEASSVESTEQTKTISPNAVAPNDVTVETSVHPPAAKNNTTNKKASYISATPTASSTKSSYSATNTSNSGSKDFANNTATPKDASLTSSTSTTTTTASITATTSTDSVTYFTNSLTPAQLKEIEQSKIKGFFVALTAGVDVSTVHYNYQNGVGYNIGAMFGYRINKNWSVQTGAIYTQKNYKMNGTDFHPPKGSYLNNYKLDMVSGSCYMWDIPIMATYHFNGTGKRNAFLSLGSSSYFMKKENYNYYFTMNNIPYNRPASYDSDEKHLFSIIHISGGIEKTIGKNLTGIIEPYAKLPLAGVGFGSIDLSSFGINFALQYRQLKTK